MQIFNVLDDREIDLLQKIFREKKRLFLTIGLICYVYKTWKDVWENKRDFFSCRFIFGVNNSTFFFIIWTQDQLLVRFSPYIFKYLEGNKLSWGFFYIFYFVAFQKEAFWTN